MTKLPHHLFVSDSDGHLYDTRVTQWHYKEPLRKNYSRGHRNIRSLADLKAALRNGAYAWPGGYPLYFITEDAAALSFATVRKEWRTIVRTYDQRHSGWRVVASAINWEDGELIDDHTGERIESAYAEIDV